MITIAKYEVRVEVLPAYSTLRELVIARLAHICELSPVLLIVLTVCKGILGGADSISDWRLVLCRLLG